MTAGMVVAMPTPATAKPQIVCAPIQVTPKPRRRRSGATSNAPATVPSAARPSTTPTEPSEPPRSCVT
ncbi:hypothetical protein NKG94_11780 [Micromonospora sp. M12]